MCGRSLRLDTTERHARFAPVQNSKLSQMSRSRSRSPERAKPKYTRAIVYEKIQQLFLPFQQWAEHILLNKITLKEDFVVDQRGRRQTYSDCLSKIAKFCWNNEVKLPRDENPVDNFILLCVAMRKKAEYNFQIYYWHFLVHVLKIELNWWFIRYKVFKWVKFDYEFPTELFNVLQYSPPSLSAAPNQFDARQLRKIQRCIGCWTKTRYKSHDLRETTPYGRRRAEIVESCKRALADMPFSSTLLDSTGPLCNYCYKGELHLHELPRARQLAIICKAAGYSISTQDFAVGFASMIRDGKVNAEERSQFEAYLEELQVPAYKVAALATALVEGLGPL